MTLTYAQRMARAEGRLIQRATALARLIVRMVAQGDFRSPLPPEREAPMLTLCMDIQLDQLEIAQIELEFVRTLTPAEHSKYLAAKAIGIAQEQAR